jgi:CRISPR-associated protein Csd1
MILQALKEYYDRKALDAESGIAPEGFEYKELPFIVLIDIDGNFIGFEDTRRQIGKNLRAESFLVPKAIKRSVNIEANLLWDNIEYVFGIPVKNKPSNVIKQHQSFKEKIERLSLGDAGVNAVLKFLNNVDLNKILSDPLFLEMREKNPFVSFKLNGDLDLICQRISVVDSINGRSSENDAVTCLVSGTRDSITRIQPPIKGVRNTNTTGGDIVSFNKDSFCSYGKTQGYNAPIGEKSSFAYTTALNHLLGKDSLQKIQIGDATTIFWSDKKSSLESIFSFLFDEPSKDNPDALTESVKSLYGSIHAGSHLAEDAGIRFFVLGLSPNAARISIRFWQVGLISEFSKKIADYFDDMNIVAVNDSKPYLPIKAYLKAIASLSDLDRVPPNLAGEWMRAILSGLQFPDSLYQMALRKSKTPRDEKKFSNKIKYVIEVQRPCMAVIKACLNRKKTINSTEKEMAVSLDKENRNIGYRLGRLFAALEIIQEEALPNINATIRDRYYSACSGTPASVMPILMRMKNHHLGKLDKPKKIFYERILIEIIGDICDFPSLLNLQDQGRFAIGYYHQRQSFFTKKESSTTDIGE